jgi:tetratricopeptide (TPR) repeat protein
MAVDQNLRPLLRAIAQSEPGSQAYGLLLQGRGREAREAARSSVELQPGVPVHSLRLVVVELDQGRVRQARQAAERLLRTAPRDPTTAEAMALVLLAEHRWLEAEATIGAVLRAEPEDEQAVWILALALEGQGRRDAAIEAFTWLRSRGRRVPTDLARQSVWRAWRWHELAGLGLMAAILAHLAIEAFRTPYEGFVGRLVAIALVVTVAGLLMIVRRRRKRLESMSDEARSAVEAESGDRRAEALLETAPRALVIGGILVGLLLGQRALADASVLFEELPVGTCFDWPPETAVPRVAPIPCDRPHHLELIGVVHYPAAVDAPYPGTSALTTYGYEHCARAFRSYVGVGYDDQVGLAVDPRFAIESYWPGHHDIYCTIRDPDWDRLMVSFRGAGRGSEAEPAP